MSSSTVTISSKTSTMNTNDRKRAISSSIRPSPSPPSAKRHGLSSNSYHTTNKIRRQSDRSSRSKQHYRHIDNKSSSSDSSRSSSNSINQDYSLSTTTVDIQNSNEILSTKKLHLNSNPKSDTIYTKKNTSIALIVKQPTTTTIDQRNLLANSDSDDEYERTKQILTKSIVSPSVMTIVTSPDLSKKSMIKDNVIIQQFDGNSNNSTKVVKLVVPQTSSSIKMLSSNDGLASALRVPTKIQLTKTLLLSSTKTEQNSLSITSNNLLDIPNDITKQEQSVVDDYHSSTTLPPTPPPPIIDNNTNSSVQKHEEKTKKISTINIKAIEETDLCENPNDQIKSKRHSSILSDWSVPPTSELSPTSLTSSSPDLTQTHVPLDDSLIELDSSIHFKQTTKRRRRSLSSISISNDKYIKSTKSKSSVCLSNSSNMKLMLIQPKRSLTSSPIIKLSSSQRIKKRRRDNENLILNHKTKTKYLKIELDTHLIIQNLLNEIIDRIISINDEKDNTLKTLLIKPVPYIEQKLILNVIPNRQTTKNSMKKKFYSTELNESRPMIMTHKELDELAYLLHTNVQRGDYERIDDPAKVEERMRDMWSQMSNQKKNSYYKRVIQIYKRPNRDVVITSSLSTSTIETNYDSIEDKTPSMNPLSVEFKRQTSTPLSFHSIASSTGDESSSNESTTKSNIFTDIVNELIKGAKGLDKLSCSPTTFINTIHKFVQSSIEKQNEILIDLEQQVEKKCSTQLNRANIFWKQKITYFATKHQINSSNEFMNELTLIVKYFYLYILSLNSQKQEIDFNTALTNLVDGNLTFNDPTYCSAVLTSIIEDLILPSTLSNDYLSSQVLIINQIEYSLPLIRNIDLENELLNKNETHLLTNPFLDFNDLDDYLNRCEHMTTTTIPTYPIQQSHHPSMYYPSYHPSVPSQYYYSPPTPQSSDMNNYYYNPSPIYPNSQQSMYQYGPSTSYYHPSTTYNNNNNNNEQFKYYYNQSQSSSYTYSSQTNSTNDIPSLSNNSSIHRTHRSIQRTYSNSQQPSTPTTPTVFDPTTAVVSPQSKSMNTINTNYPS